MAQHTPGPWEFEPSRYGYGYSVLWNPDTRHEVLIPGGVPDVDGVTTWMGEELSDADKALIAAAPDLLAALRDCVEALAHTQDTLGLRVNPPTLEIARATIAKATAP